jgi:hypothetical protein
MYKVAVTGGRDFWGKNKVFAKLGELHSKEPIDLLVHGNCPTGVDALAAKWADANGVPHTGSKYSANWDAYGLEAGPRRNREMLEAERPDLLVVFPGNSGTRNCEGVGLSLEIPIDLG